MPIRKKSGFGPYFLESFKDASHDAMMATLRDLLQQPEKDLRASEITQQIGIRDQDLADAAKKERQTAEAELGGYGPEAKEVADIDASRALAEKRRADVKNNDRRLKATEKALDHLSKKELLNHQQFLLKTTQGKEFAVIRALDAQDGTSRADDLLDQLDLVNAKLGPDIVPPKMAEPATPAASATKGASGTGVKYSAYATNGRERRGFNPQTKKWEPVK